MITHTALGTRQKIAEVGWEILSHPPYSWDIAPSDCHLFLSLQNFLKKFKNEEDVEQAHSSLFFASKDETFFQNGIYKLHLSWQQIVNK